MLVFTYHYTIRLFGASPSFRRSFESSLLTPPSKTYEPTACLDAEPLESPKDIRCLHYTCKHHFSLQRKGNIHSMRKRRITNATALTSI
ncbi:hypothetical protein VTL71DRAFT_3466 [Oculimacula yallundae]|uniref:Uncharacterized protein n=1 Tax=Oculimacula yallundae TaxID=86028 RepID=A0ABR4C8E1_9HELO